MEEKANHQTSLKRAMISSDKNKVTIEGNTFLDTEGGFLLEEFPSDEPTPAKTARVEDPLLEGDADTTCEECGKDFLVSYLMKTFDFPVCDGCKDTEDKHQYITRTDAKAEYLLKDCDIDKRDPPLKFILKKNPHNSNWGQMRLYLLPQIEKRAIEVWGSMEKLEEAHNDREEKRLKAKTKKYNKNLKALRMSVRSSLFDRSSGPSHVHDFGPEKYNEEEDTYSKTCKTCPFTETYEKM